MSKEKFTDWNPTVKTEELLEQTAVILEQYAGMNIRLTLRQLYYQLVSRNIIANRPSEYSRLSSVISQARLAGLMDWWAIEDRIRQPHVPSEWESLQDLVDSAVMSYRLPRWDGQKNMVELWSEKDALRSVLEPITNQYHVTLMVNRGYSSSSAMYDAKQRFQSAIAEGKQPVLLYLGDFDPSGEDMVRDIENRLTILRTGVHIYKVALTTGQIEEFKLPPNPAKKSDPRAGDFISKHGEESYEVDALPPEALMKLIRGFILQFLDIKKYKEVVKREDLEKKQLVKLAKRIKGAE